MGLAFCEALVQWGGLLSALFGYSFLASQLMRSAILPPFTPSVSPLEAKREFALRAKHVEKSQPWRLNLVSSSRFSFSKLFI